MSDSATKVIGVVMVGLGAVALIGLLIVGSVLLNAAVVVRLWAWFVAPTFGLPLLTLPVAVGLASLAHAVQHSHREWEKEDESQGARIGRVFAVLVFRPALLLLIGYVAHRWTA